MTPAKKIAEKIERIMRREVTTGWPSKVEIGRLASAYLNTPDPMTNERLKDLEYDFTYRNWQADTSAKATELFAEIRRFGCLFRDGGK